MSHEAVIYDLDGTLVELPVDWTAVDDAVRAVIAERTGAETGGKDAWDLLPVADEHGERAAVEAEISKRERAAAADAERLPLADELAGAGEKVGVCSLNCEAAVRRALEAHGLERHVGSVVGRDTVATEKPAPEPLRRTMAGLGATPEKTLFVGDSPRDEETARRAGTDFVYVAERLQRA
jgi:phosphoglycolate phosphatase